MKVRWLLGSGRRFGGCCGGHGDKRKPPGPGGPGFRPGFGPGMGGGPMMLLMNPQVQKELGLTEEQLRKTSRSWSQLDGTVAREVPRPGDLPPEERRQRMATLMEEARAQAEEALKPVVDGRAVKAAAAD